jgi:hypothetical protein
MAKEIVIQGITISNNAVDSLSSANKAVWGSLPLIGAVCSEIFNNIIPQQRMDRMADLFKILDHKIQELALNTQELHTLMTGERFTELLEDAMYQAARATSEERRHYLASFLATSLTSSEANAIKEKKLLYILGQLNDVEVILLKFYSISGKTVLSSPFYELHRTILEWESVKADTTENEKKQILERHEFRTTHTEHLKTMGVCRINTYGPMNGEHHHPVIVTDVGSLLLKYIGLNESA